MRLGVIGAGVVGSAVGGMLKARGHHVEFDDPPKKLFGDLEGCEAIFLCVPIATNKDRSLDLSIVKESIMRWKNIDCPFFMKSTVLPGTCDRLAYKTKKNIVSMPEFLTERTAHLDIERQPIVCGTPTPDIKPLVENIFPNKTVHFMKNQEAEMAKYVHNCFGAVKVHYFNVIKDACNKLSIDYQKVLEGATVTGFIEKTHTQVPGPDGKKGYGGKCFPKDMAAFIGFLSTYQVQTTIFKRVEFENQMIRGAE